MAAPVVCSAMRMFSRSFQHAKIFTKQTSLAPVQNASIRHYMNVRGSSILLFKCSWTDVWRSCIQCIVSLKWHCHCTIACHALRALFVSFFCPPPPPPPVFFCLFCPPSPPQELLSFSFVLRDNAHSMLLPQKAKKKKKKKKQQQPHTHTHTTKQQQQHGTCQNPQKDEGGHYQNCKKNVNLSSHIGAFPWCFPSLRTG